MKNYERLDMSLEILDSSDVIATSSEVTTDKITIKWNGVSTETSNYELD